jgi:hypothetical protein
MIKAQTKLGIQGKYLRNNKSYTPKTYGQHHPK